MDSDHPTITQEKQWIHTTVENKMASGDLKVQKAEVSLGKFYKFPDKGNEIGADEVNKEVASPGGSNASIAACGRYGSPTGTEGSFELYDENTRVCLVSWSCPFGAFPNKFTVSRIPDGYTVQHTDAPDDSAIGNMTIKVVKTT